LFIGETATRPGSVWVTGPWFWVRKKHVGGSGWCQGWVTSQKQEAQSSSIFFLLLMDPSKERLVLPGSPSNVSARRAGRRSQTCRLSFSSQSGISENVEDSDKTGGHSVPCVKVLTLLPKQKKSRLKRVTIPNFSTISLPTFVVIPRDQGNLSLWNRVLESTFKPRYKTLAAHLAAEEAVTLVSINLRRNSVQQLPGTLPINIG
jgi:hypothetical protein